MKVLLVSMLLVATAMAANHVRMARASKNDVDVMSKWAEAKELAESSFLERNIDVGLISKDVLNDLAEATDFAPKNTEGLDLDPLVIPPPPIAPIAPPPSKIPAPPGPHPDGPHTHTVIHERVEVNADGAESDDTDINTTTTDGEVEADIEDLPESEEFAEGEVEEVDDLPQQVEITDANEVDELPSDYEQDEDEDAMEDVEDPDAEWESFDDADDEADDEADELPSDYEQDEDEDALEDVEDPDAEWESFDDADGEEQEEEEEEESANSFQEHQIGVTYSIQKGGFGSGSGSVSSDDGASSSGSGSE